MQRIKSHQSFMQSQNHSSFVQTRVERDRNEGMVKAYKHSVWKGKRHQRSSVRNHEKTRRKKIKSYNRSLVRRSEQNYEGKMARENDKMNEMEQLILAMEMQENQLLDRLKNSQQAEQEQFSRLEIAIQDSNEAWQRRKLEMDSITKPLNTSRFGDHSSIAFTDMTTMHGSGQPKRKIRRKRRARTQKRR